MGTLISVLKTVCIVVTKVFSFHVHTTYIKRDFVLITVCEDGNFVLFYVKKRRASTDLHFLSFNAGLVNLTYLHVLYQFYHFTPHFTHYNSYKYPTNI